MKFLTPYQRILDIYNNTNYKYDCFNSNSVDKLGDLSVNQIYLNYMFDFLERINDLNGLFISFITIYLFYLRFVSKHVKVIGVRQDNYSGFYDRAITFIIENKSLSPIALQSVSAVVDNKYIMHIARYPSFVILKPWETMTVSKTFTTATQDILDITGLPWANLFLVLNTSRGEIISRFREECMKERFKKAILKYYKNMKYLLMSIPRNNREKVRQLRIEDRKNINNYYNKYDKKYKRVRLIQDTLDGKILSKDIEYVLIYGNIGDNRKHILIKKIRGSMREVNGSFFGTSNFLRNDQIETKEQLTQYFDKHLKDVGVKCKFHIYDIHDLKGTRS